MVINRISASSVSNYKTQNNTNFGSDNKKSKTLDFFTDKKKLPYIATGIALATLAGIYVLKKPSSANKTIKEIQPNLKNEIDEITETVAKQLKKESAKENKIQIIEEVKKEVETISETVTNQLKKGQVEEKTAQVTQEFKKETSKIAEEFQNIKPDFVSKDPEMAKYIKDTTTRCTGEYRAILRENTYDGMINLDNMDKAAEMRSLDKTRKNHLHEAANMLEESYKEAYQKAQDVDGQNMLDKIYYRLDKESKVLPNIYSKMDKDVALERINLFTQAAFNLKPQKGMTSAELFNKIVEFMEKAKA